jgi:LysM repeat protein
MRVVVALVIFLLLGVIAGGLVVGLSQLGAPREGMLRGTSTPAAVQEPQPTASERRILTTPGGTPDIQPELSASPPSTPEPTPNTWRYTVVAGDSLSLIGIRFGTTTDEILALNPQYRADPNNVPVGAEILVPCTSIAVAEARCP